MPRIETSQPLKLQIIKTASRLFFERGFSSTTSAAISKELGISTGNLTYHFPTKEHLLFELVKKMCEFKRETVQKDLSEGTDPLHAYALEISVQTALCEHNDIAKDFYVSSYILPLTLAEIREWDVKKAMQLFSSFNPDWVEDDFVLAGITASGIELSALMAESNEVVTLEKKISNTLDTLLKLYNVPESERKATIKFVSGIDYNELSQKTLEMFLSHINKFSNIDYKL